MLESGVSGHGLLRFIHLDPSGLLGSLRITGLVSAYSQAAFITAPSMMTPAVAYFQSATEIINYAGDAIAFPSLSLSGEPHCEQVMRHPRSWFRHTGSGPFEFAWREQFAQNCIDFAAIHRCDLRG